MITVIAIVGAIGFLNLFGYREIAQLDSAAEAAISSIRSAQNQAVIQQNSSQWGVNFVRQAAGSDYYNIYMEQVPPLV